jgi:seryl-tRNA synthetase
MLDIKTLRDDIDLIETELSKRGYSLDVKKFKLLDSNRKSLQVKVEELQSSRKKLSEEFGKLKSTGDDTGNLKKQINELNDALKESSNELDKILDSLNIFLLDIPNVPHISCPQGSDENDNVVIKKYGLIDSSKKIDHLSISNEIDTDLATKLAGPRFAVLKGDMARLQRALISLMLDTAIKNGYEEYYLPYMANKDSLTGVGQLPKFEEDLFKTTNGLYLIPTAEVPLTNIFRNTTISHNELPMKVTAHTPCFRSEAGSYGRDTKGLIRQHQFEKIELMQVCHPDQSMDDLEGLLNNAKEILDLLELPYQIIELCSGDLGFSSCKTYDIEVWMPGQGKYREISSCSNFSDFQARRSNIKLKDQNNKKILVHTINGSGLALGRTLIALIENNYDQDKEQIIIPKALLQYFDKNIISLK